MLAAECDESFDLTVHAAHAQEPVLEPAAFQIVVELPVDKDRQAPPLAAEAFSKDWVVLLDELVKQRLLGTAASISHAARHRG
jgi:hypothetical protein